ncbi:MobA/MobL family protein [Novispirillum sp. DQ9]|uniref:MobA/MobL family protein n=1 Tax=Novispirillum sp. DQ9 TaxID=3398612 RepID=UPI003C7AB373
MELFSLATEDLWDEVGKSRMGRLDENEQDARLAAFGFRTRRTVRPASTRPTWAGPKPKTRAQSFHFRHTTLAKPNLRSFRKRVDEPRAQPLMGGVDFHVYASKAERAEKDRERELLSDDLGFIEVSNIGPDGGGRKGVPTAEEAEAFWLAVYGAERRDGRVQSRLAVEVPHELPPGLVRLALARFCEEFWDHGLPFYAVVHKPGLTSDPRNVHAHILYHDRPALRRPDGGWDFAQAKAAVTRDIDWVRTLRERWSEVINEALDIAAESAAAAGRDGPEKRYDPRSFAAVGIAKRPSLHLGPKWAALERQGVPTKVGAYNAQCELGWQMVLQPQQRLEAAAADVAEAIDGYAEAQAKAGRGRLGGPRRERSGEALDALGEAHLALEKQLTTTTPDLVLQRVYREHDDLVSRGLIAELDRIMATFNRVLAERQRRQDGKPEKPGRRARAEALQRRARTLTETMIEAGVTGRGECRVERPLPHTADGRPRGTPGDVVAAEERFAAALAAARREAEELRLAGALDAAVDAAARARRLGLLRVRPATSPDAPAVAAERERRAAGRHASERDEAAAAVRQALRPVRWRSGTIEDLLSQAVEGWRTGGDGGVRGAIEHTGELARMRGPEAAQVASAVREYAQAAVAAEAAGRAAQEAAELAEREAQWLAHLRLRADRADAAEARVLARLEPFAQWFGEIYRDGGKAAVATLRSWAAPAAVTGRDASLFLEPGGLGFLRPGIDAEAVVPEVLADKEDRLARAYEVVMVLRTADSSHRDLEDVLMAPPGSVAPAEVAGEIARARAHLDERFGTAGEVLLESGRRLWRWSGHDGLPAADDIAALVLRSVPQEDAPDRLLVVEALRLGLTRATLAAAGEGDKAPPAAAQTAGPAQGPEGTNDYGMGCTPAADPATAATVDAEISVTVRIPSAGSEEAEPTAATTVPAVALPMQAPGPKPILGDASDAAVLICHQVSVPLAPRNAPPQHVAVAAPNDPGPAQLRSAEQAADPGEPAAIVIEPVRLAPDVGARLITLEALRQMPVPELKARGIVTAIALDRKVAEIRAEGMTRRRIQAKCALQDGLIAVRNVLASRGERLPDHRPTKEAAVVRRGREI